MTHAAEEPSYESDPNYLAFVEAASPPWREAWTSTRPPLPETLSTEDQHKMIQANLSLVDSAVQKLIRHGTRIDVEEAVQDGAIGLCEAAERYDPSKAPFAAYAPHRVRGAIVDGVRTYDKLGGENRTAARVVSLLNNTRAVSLSSPAYSLTHGGTMTIEDTIPADQPSTEDVVEATDTLERLHALIDLLVPRQREVLLMTAQCIGQQAIASSLGISERTVRRDLQNARSVLKSHLQDQLIEQWV